MTIWMKIALAVAVFISALAVVDESYRYRLAVADYESLHAEHLRLSADTDRLKLDLAAWSAPSRLETLAGSLGLRRARPNEMEMIK